jgi:hypothetical protein
MNNKDFLIALKDYIEKVELQIEGEWGGGRSLAKLISKGEMPEIYDEVLSRLDKESK